MRQKEDRRIKIAYIIGQLTVGGTERQLLELVRNLDHKNFELIVVSLSKEVTLSNLFRQAGCEVHILNREDRGRLLALLDLYKLFRRFKPAIIHSYAYASRAAIPVSKLITKSKSVVSIRTQPSWQVNRLDKLINAFADYILTNSKMAATTAHFGFTNSVPLRVIYNGIDLRKFDRDLNSEFPLSPVLSRSGAKIIGVVARLHPVKALDVLLDAFAIVTNEFDNIHLWIIGDGPEKERLEERAFHLGMDTKVVFWEQQDNIPAFLRHVDVGVLSSRVEGLPNAVIEYMAAGLPVVATNVGGNPELVVHEETGLLVPPGHPQAIADALLYLLRHPDVCRHMGEAGRKRIEAHFTLERMVREIEEVYESLCQIKQ